jgi:hypothetical protein
VQLLFTVRHTLQLTCHCLVLQVLQMLEQQPNPTAALGGVFVTKDMCVLSHAKAFVFPSTALRCG